MIQKLGQVPLVLGPGSWGFPGLLPPPDGAAAPIPCPEGLLLSPSGSCLPRVARDGPPLPDPPMLFPAQPLWGGWF